MELLGILFGLLILAMVIGFLALPIIAIVRTNRVGDFERRLSALEQAIRRDVPPQPAVANVEPVPVVRRATPDLAAVLPPPPARPRRDPAVLDVAALEAWIGRRGLGWASAVLLLFATAFFIKYAFDNQWIGPVGRVAAGLAGGTALVLLGYRFHRRGWRVFGQIPSAAGVAMLYLSAYAAFGYYHLIPQQHAAVALVILVIEAAALAVLYDAPAIAVMALVGGLVTPILLHTDRDQYRSLFGYLAVLNASAVGLALIRPWRYLGFIALIGTQALYWMWYDEHFHPEKLSAALLFQTLLFALGLAFSLAANVYRPQRATPLDLIRLLLNAGLFALAGSDLLDDKYHVWLGTLALVAACVYAAMGWAVQRVRPDDTRQLLVVVATALAFIAIAIPLQANTNWIAVGWAVMGLALWWFGLRIDSRTLCGFGLILLVWSCGWLVLADTPWGYRSSFVPLFNKYGTPACAVAGCVLAAAALARRKGVQEPRLFLAAVGLLLLWFILSVETFGYFHKPEYGNRVDALRTVQMALSIVWAIYATILLTLGFQWRSLPMRVAALIVFAVTLAKVLLLDMAGLPGIYRIVAFFALAVAMAGAAWGYQKFQVVRLAAGREET